MFNALDVLPDGGTVQLRVSSEAVADGRPPRVVIRVEDTGPGLPVGLEDQIFEPFVSTKEAGLGLGLVDLPADRRDARRVDRRRRPARPAAAVFTVRLPGSFRGQTRPRGTAR